MYVTVSMYACVYMYEHTVHDIIKFTYYHCTSIDCRVHCTLNEKEGSMPHSESHQKHIVVHWVFKYSDSLLVVCLQLTEDNFSYLAFSTVLSSSNVI